MDFAYPEHLTHLKERAAALTEKIMAYEDDCEAYGGLRPETHDAIRQLVVTSGLHEMNMPVEWSGGGLNWLEQVAVEEELGRLTNALYLTVWRSATALLACTPQQREQYLLPEIAGQRFGGRAFSEPGGGSDARSMATTATWTGNHYRINGEKWFVTMGDIADYFIVLAVVTPENLPTLFLVDRNSPGVELTAVPRYTHNSAYGHPHFSFTDVVVGPDAVLGEVGGGLKLVQETLLEERMVVAAHAVGAAKRALSLATEWARERVVGGQPIIRWQLVQAMIADSATDIALSRAFVHQLAWELDNGGDPKTMHAKVAMAKLSTSEAAGRVIDRAVQIFGGRGFIRDNPVERLYRDTRLDRIWMGTSEIQRLVIANEIDKRGLDGLLEFRTSAAVSPPA